MQPLMKCSPNQMVNTVDTMAFKWWFRFDLKSDLMTEYILVPNEVIDPP